LIFQRQMGDEGPGSFEMEIFRVTFGSLGKSIGGVNPPEMSVEHRLDGVNSGMH